MAPNSTAQARARTRLVRRNHRRVAARLGRRDLLGARHLAERGRHRLAERRRVAVAGLERLERRGRLEVAAREQVGHHLRRAKGGGAGGGVEEETRVRNQSGGGDGTERASRNADAAARARRPKKHKPPSLLPRLLVSHPSNNPHLHEHRAPGVCLAQPVRAERHRLHRAGVLRDDRLDRLPRGLREHDLAAARGARDLEAERDAGAGDVRAVERREDVAHRRRGRRLPVRGGPACM